MGLNEKDLDKYAPFSGSKRTKPMSLLEFLKLKIDLTAKVNFNDTLEEALRKATTRYFCSECSTQITAAWHEKYSGTCKACFTSLHSR